MGRDLYEPPPPRHDAGMSRRALLRLRLTDRARADIDYDGVTERVRAGWERGGHEPLLRALEPVAGEVVAAAARAAAGGGHGAGAGTATLAAGSRVLDAGAGDGNVARAALARGAAVDACDLSAGMVERGRVACPGARWTQGDVQALPYPDGRFDAALSAFGFALAPRARRCARELVRVVRPGGVVALAAWVPRGLPGRFPELADQLPDGVRSPGDWGRQDAARRRLEPLLDDLDIRLRTVRLQFRAPEALLDALARPAGLTAAGRTALRPAFDRLLASCNADPHGAVQLDARYLLITGTRPG